MEFETWGIAKYCHARPLYRQLTFKVLESGNEK